MPIAQPLPAAGPALAYLDVSEREITWVEEPTLLEKALHGVDSSARRQVLWQVKLHAMPNPSCTTDLDALFPPSHGRLTTDATGTPASDDPCILPPEGGYRGLENRLYRVQVLVPGPPGTARFKWSRENASVVSPVETIQSSGTHSQVQVTRIGRDAVLRFAPGDWVEVTDDWRDWLGEAGDMARIDTIDEPTRTIFLDRVVPASGTTPFAPDAAGHQSRHTKLIRWDQSLERHGNAVDPGTGLMAAGAFPIALEDGVQVGFGAASGTSGAMRIGDHWSFTARTVDGSVQQLDAAPPDGIRHVYVPLAVVYVGAAGITVVSDCRNLVPPSGETRPERVCECCTICVGEGREVADLEAAMAALPNLAPDPATAVRICLLPGDHEIGDGLDVDRPNTRIVGCFPRSRLHVRGAGLRFSANLTGIEEVVVLGAAERGMVAFRGVEDGFVRRCWFESDGGGPFALVAEATRRLTIEDSRLTGAGLGLLGGCREVRVRGNAVERFASSAIAIDSAESQDIEIRRNRLVDGLGSGIEVISHPERLAIVDNEIATCRGENNTFGGVAGGIVILEAVDDLTVRDNRITDNAGAARSDAAGVCVARGRGVEIARNRIEGNGLAEIDGQPIAGGIVIDAVQARPDPDGNERHRFDPALVVADNLVIAPRGHALFVIGEGDIRVQDNSLISQLGVARSAGPDDLGARDAAAVVLIGTPRLDGLARILIEAGVQGPNAPLEVSSVCPGQPRSGPRPGDAPGQPDRAGATALRRSHATDLVGGRDLRFTDIDLARNQVELNPSEGSFCLDALVVALSTRQQGNRLTEREGSCLASLLSVGFALNTCSQNQGSHCILPFSPQKLAASDNLVEFPSDLCREG